VSAPSGIEAGTVLEPRTYPVTRATLVRYAGASGDFNPIHWSDRVAGAVGLPGVIAHGMLTQALAARAVAEWTADWADGAPAQVVELGAKFTNPVVVPDDDTGIDLVVAGTVKAVDVDLVTLALEVTAGGTKVLGNPRAVVRA
jgi:acyl dehydratase